MSKSGKGYRSRIEVLELRRHVIGRSPDADARLAEALERLPQTAASLQELHDLFLFVEAHPASPSQLEVARHGLVAIAAHVLKPAHERLRSALRDSGISGTETVGLYSLTLVRWLLAHWPKDVRLSSVEASVDELAELLRPMLTEAEREAMDMHDGDVASLMALLFGKDPCKQLLDLVELLDAHPASDELRETLFARLQVYISISSGFPSLTALRGPAHPTFIHADSLQRGVDLHATVAKGIGPPLALNKRQRSQLVNDARAILCLMQRETDPITYAQEVQAFDMGRGLVIALFHMDAAHRLALESYVGFMAFKNGVPLGYGGAWLFPARSKVGINVFPSLRGGESAWFFAQLLRLYRQRFGVGVFEAENYQLGYGNADGLKSGAYWFYYRLGFRPWDERLGRIAAREVERMLRNKAYQPPLRTLKELVADGLVLRVADESSPMVDTSALIHAAQQHALGNMARSRQQMLAEAERRARKAFGLTRAECARPGIAVALKAWSLPLNLLGEYERWPPAELKRMGRALRAKAASNEDAYQAGLRECTMLLRSWAEASKQT
ncbi:MAG TPA: hypothetical protein PKY96_00815 [Flavobacteriales bacterium]|nr:hypothetical protein [Flavobacteriales bacterium]